VPVWSEVLADLTTPVAAFARVVGDGEGFLLESVENGDTWSRWSFIGRNPQATIVSKDGTLEIHGAVGIELPTDQGMLHALECLLDHYRSPELEGLPPLHGGLVGYLGYDVVREVEHLPEVPDDDLGHPDAVVSMIGELAVYDHWKQRVTLIANVFVSDDTDLEAAYDDGAPRGR
jgi:anthranilate synthase component 1